MAHVETVSGITSGRTEDGRISYYSSNNGPKIDGRWAWRGSYLGPNGVVTDERVEAAVWAVACELMAQVDAAHQSYSDELTRKADEAADRREAALEGIERVRGGAYDPNAY